MKKQIPSPTSLPPPTEEIDESWGDDLPPPHEPVASPRISFPDESAFTTKTPLIPPAAPEVPESSRRVTTPAPFNAKRHSSSPRISAVPLDSLALEDFDATEAETKPPSRGPSRPARDIESSAPEAPGGRSFEAVVQRSICRIESSRAEPPAPAPAPAVEVEVEELTDLELSLENVFETSPLSWVDSQVESSSAAHSEATPVPEPLSDPTSDATTTRDLRDRYAVGDFTGALIIAEGILDRDPENEDARRYAQSCREVLTQMYAARLGSLDQIVTVTTPPEQITWLSLDHRAGFLLSLIDGVSSVDEILDISGMTRLEALRILYTLVQQNVIELD